MRPDCSLEWMVVASHSRHTETSGSASEVEGTRRFTRAVRCNRDHPLVAHLKDHQLTDGEKFNWRQALRSYSHYSVISGSII